MATRCSSPAAGAGAGGGADGLESEVLWAGRVRHANSGGAPSFAHGAPTNHADRCRAGLLSAMRGQAGACRPFVQPLCAADRVRLPGVGDSSPPDSVCTSLSIRCSMFSGFITSACRQGGRGGVGLAVQGAVPGLQVRPSRGTVRSCACTWQRAVAVRPVHSMAGHQGSSPTGPMLCKSGD